MIESISGRENLKGNADRARRVAVGCKSDMSLQWIMQAKKAWGTLECTHLEYTIILHGPPNKNRAKGELIQFFSLISMVPKDDQQPCICLKQQRCF